jgi:CRISPR-associated exonuclease Cas4
MSQFIHNFTGKLIADLLSVNTDLILLTVLIVATIVVIDSVRIYVRKSREASGLGAKSVAISVDGSKSAPSRHYVSENQGLAGKPDAVINEGGCVIPVERKPLARKLRDRYVAQLLVYMRLIEEFEGKRPPHGYLILGPSCRRFKIENTPERQAWLQKMLDEMQLILAGTGKVVPKPQPRKCGKCDVNAKCRFAFKPGSNNPG